MYSWLIFLHVISIFAFLLAHGISAGVFFALRRERNPDHIRLLLQLSSSSFSLLGISLLLILVSGIILGFLGRWWSNVWIWLSLALFIALYGIMSGLGTRVLNELRVGLGLPSIYNQQPKPEQMTSQELDAVINRSRPSLLAAIGFGGIALITWLMLFKPF